MQPFSIAAGDSDQKEIERIDKETQRWWFRLHGDCLRFIDDKAALQFIYNTQDGFLIFRDPKRPFFNSLTQADSFGVR